MRWLLFLVPLALTLGGCLPNPQSEWTSSGGGSQRPTLEDPTILAQSTAPPGFFDFDWAVPSWGNARARTSSERRASHHSQHASNGGGAHRH